MAFIGIGCESGGPEATEVGQLKVPLYKALETHVKSTHCSAIDQYAIVLRVDGSLATFGDEGLARLRFAKAQRYISIDVQITETAWRSRDAQQLKIYIANQVKAAIKACVARLRKDKHPVSEALLEAEVDAAITEYLGIA